jgi:PAS domain S-box-containing protein
MQEQMEGTPREEYLEHRFIRKDGQLRWVRVTATVIQYKGKPALQTLYEDRTEQKQAEEALRKSEAWLKSVFRAAPTGIGVVCDRVLTDVNDRFCEIVGYSPEELLGQNAIMVYPSREEYEWVGEEKYRQISEHGIGTVETRFKRKDGQIVDVLVSSAPLDLSNFSKGVTFTALDITERKRAAEQLQASEEKYRELVEELREGVLTENTETIITFANPRAADLLGYSPEELIGQPLSMTIPEEEYERIREKAAKRSSGISSTYETTLLTKDRHLLPVLISATPLFTSTGVYRGTLSVFTDISEYKRAEHALNERVKELNCLYGIARIVEQPGLSLSEILQEIAQLLPGAWQYPDIAGGCIVYEGKQFVTEKFQPDEWIQTADIRVQGRKEGFVTVSYADERPERAGGEEPFLKEERLLINAIADRLGEIIERKQAEELLKQEKEELSEFTHAMAHDLRNRLVAIEGYAALLKKGHDESYIEKIGSLAKNMNELLHRSVTLADAGLVIEKIDMVDLMRLVQEVAESVIPDSISFRHDFLPAVRGDRHKLAQVFQNLFENAIAHGKPRKIEVSMGSLVR